MTPNLETPPMVDDLTHADEAKIAMAIAHAVADQGFDLSAPQAIYVAGKAIEAMPARTPPEVSEEMRTMLRRLCNNAAVVMEMLEHEGPRVVPHLIDTDDNAGEYLRQAISDARAILAALKGE